MRDLIDFPNVSLAQAVLIRILLALKNIESQWSVVKVALGEDDSINLLKDIKTHSSR